MTRFRYLIFVFLAMLASSRCAVAQKLRFDRYTLNDGLSQSTIVSMLQDRQGFIWIGTEDGLNRFDGHQFKIFRKNPTDSLHTLGGNFVWDLYEAPSGHLWIAHEGGVSVFDPVRESFKAYKIGDGSAIVKSILPRDATSLWVGTSGQGLFLLDLAQDRVTQYINTSPELLKHNNILDLAYAANGDVLVGTRGAGLFAFNPEKKFFRPNILPTQDSTLLYANDIWKITLHQGHYWLGTLKGLIQLHDDFRIKQYEPLPHGDRPMQRISTLLFNPDGTLWIACYGGGLVHFNPATRQSTFYEHHPTDPYSLSNDLVFSLLRDRADNLWVGTWVAGISKLRKGYHNFVNYSNHDLGTPSDFITSAAVLACNGQQHLMLGIYGGGLRLAALDQGLDALSFAPMDRMPAEAWAACEPVNGLTVGRQHLWVASDLAGVVGLPLQAIGCQQPIANVTRYVSQGTPHTLSTNAVKTIYEDHRGNLWVGTIGGGLNYIDMQRPYGTPGSVTTYVNHPEDSTSLAHNRVNHLLEDRDHRLWIATGNGLNLLQGNAFRRFLSGKIISLLEHRSGTLYIGTANGLYRRQAGADFHFESVAPLSGQLINAIREDGASKLWLSTNKGLYWYDPATNTAMAFRSSDGLQDDEYNFNAAAAHGNILAFGGVNGLSVFQADRIVLNQVPPPVVLTGLKVSNRDVETGDASALLAQSLPFQQTLTFAHDQNYLTFAFAALDYTNPAKNQYAYRLEGLDPDWIYTQNRSATYTNLDPGTYTLHIRAANNDGTWNDAGTQLQVIIRPPWWRSWWAYSLYGLLALAALVLGRRAIIQQERLRTQLEVESVEVKKLKELDDFKSRFFANISHEFRTPLSLILGPTDRLLEHADADTRHDLVTIRNNGRSLLNLVNQMLDLSRIEAGTLRLQVAETNLTRCLRIFAEGFHSLATQKGIQFTIRISPDIHGFADVSFLEKIVNNLLANAVKYTPTGGAVEFIANGYDQQLYISVKDTGQGIAPDQLHRIFERFYRIHESTTVEGTGLGLALTRELAKTHQGDITVYSTPEKGSVFSVTLPLARQAYKDGDVTTQAPDLLTDRVSYDADTPWTPAAFADDDQEKPVLLVIEDNDELRAFIKSTLSPSFQVREARDGEEGLALAIEEVPDIIVSDWMMPRMDGVSVCRAIKSHEATNHIPFILLTAKAGIDSRVEGLETGADDYLTKPFDIRELRVRAANLIDQRKKLQAKYAKTVTAVYRSVKVASANDKFLQRLQEVMEQNLADSRFGVEEMAHELGMSRVQLYRKVTALTGKTAVEFLRHYRLERAAELLRQGVGQVAEVAYQVGFDNPSYFTKIFREQFGKLPSEVTKD